MTNEFNHVHMNHPSNSSQQFSAYKLIASVYLDIIRSTNCLSPDRRQATIWNNADVLSMRPLGKKKKNFNETILIQKNTYVNGVC